MNRLKLTIVICALGFISFSQSKKAETFLNEYQSVAINEKGGLETPALKWIEDTVTYQVIGEKAFLNSKKWEEFISEIEALTSLVFVESKDSDITIFFGKMTDYFEWLGEEMPAYVTNFNNWGRRRWNNDYELIHSSYCLVPQKIGIANYGIYQLKRWFLISLGLNGNSVSNTSILYNSFTQKNYYISKRDKQILKIHYSEFIRSGMNKNDLEVAINSNFDLDLFLKEKL